MKQLFFVISLFLFNCLTAFSIDFSQEWNKVDSLMQKPALRDADFAIRNIKNKAEKINDARQLLKAEIYSYLVDIGCEFSPNDTARVHKPNNLNKEEGKEIIEKHYCNAKSILDKLSNKGERLVCEMYICLLLSEYEELCRDWHNKLIERNDSTEVSLNEMMRSERSILYTKHLDTLLASAESIGDMKASEVSDFFVFLGKNEGEDMLLKELVCDDLSVLQAKGVGSIPVLSLGSIDSLPEKNEMNLKNRLYGEFERFYQERGDTAKIMRYELKRIKNYQSQRNAYNTTHKDSASLLALDKLIAKYPDHILVLEAEKMRADILLKELNETWYEHNFKENEKTKHVLERLNAVCEKFSRERYKNNAEDADNLLNPLRECIARIEQHAMECSVKEQYHSKETIKVFITHKNVKSVKMALEKCTSSGAKYQDMDDEYAALPLNKSEFQLKPSNYYIPTNDTLDLGYLDYGAYLLTISDAEDNDSAKELEFVVSDFSTIQVVANKEHNYYEAYIVDYLSGKPQSNVKIRATDSEVKRTVRTDKNGYVKLKYKEEEDDARIIRYFVEEQEFYPSKGKDCYGIPFEYEEWDIVENPNESDSTKNVLLKTDRKVYRPNQKVKFFGVCYMSMKKGDKVLANTEVEVELHRGSDLYKSQKLTTDDFGKFFSKFDIEEDDDAIGRYSFTIKFGEEEFNNTGSFYVEAYKLQQFEVNFDDCNKLEENITVSGVVKTLAGEVLPNAQVRLEIRNKTYNLITDSLGKFSTIYQPDSVELSRTKLNLTVEASVISPSGETIEKHTTFYLKKDNVELELKNSYTIDLAKESKLYLKAFTYDRQKENPINAEKLVKIRLYDSDGKLSFDKEHLIYGTTGISFDSLPVGEYKIKVFDAKGIDTTSTPLIDTEIILYNSASNECPTKKMLWTSYYKYARRIFLDEDSTAKISVSTYANDAYLLCRIADNTEKLIKNEWIKMDRCLKTLSFSYRLLFGSTQREGVCISLYLHKDGEHYYDNFYVVPQRKSKKLKATISSFREKVNASSHQKWQIEVEGTKEPVSIAAAITDAALDAYSPNSWKHYINAPYPQFVWNYHRGYMWEERMYADAERYEQELDSFPYREKSEMSYPLWFVSSTVYRTSGRLFAYIPTTIPPQTSLDTTKCKDFYLVKGRVRDAEEGVPFCNIEIVGTSIGTNSDADGYYEILVPKSNPVLSFSFSGYEAKTVRVDRSRYLDVELEQTVLEEIVMVGYGVQKATNREEHIEETLREETVSEEPQPVLIRSNFSETAFFMPNIETSNGKAEIEFDMPDNLTRWNIKIFSHTKDFCVGSDEFVIHSSMPFTIRPLMPRVFRSGDYATVSATITSNDGKEAKGVATFIVEDEESGKEICRKTTDFYVPAKSSHTVEWSFDVPKDVEKIKVKTTAQGKDFSDGEEHSIPVVSNLTHIVKSQSALVRKGETKRLTISTDSMENASLTIESVPNAMWQAVMAMPSLVNETYNDAIDCAASLYVNSISQNVASDYPEIYGIVKLWEADSVLANSPLKQNNKFNTASLKSSPWENLSKRETEQRRNIIDMLDRRKAKSRTAILYDKLENLQCADGGFSWFGDGNSSLQTSIYVCEIFSKLHQQKLFSEKTKDKDMFHNALNYIDKEIVKSLKEYKEEKKHNGAGIRISENVIRTIYLRLATKDYEPLSDSANAAVNAYMKDLEPRWKDLTLFGKSSFARSLMRVGKNDLAKEIMRAVFQSSTTNAERGIYWKENQDNCSWSNSAIAVHTEAMCALIETKQASEEEIAEMQLWLLSKKETQVWRSPTSTIDAIDVLLRSSSNVMNTSGEVRLPNGETVGTKNGILRRSFSAVSKENIIEVKGSEASIGFASLYAETETENKNITASANHISIKKTLYRIERRTTALGNEIETQVKLNAGDIVNIGDKLIVMLTVSCDQDLDYVCVSDTRASCLEPEKLLSGYRWENGAHYYQNITDTSVRFFFDRLFKGTYNLSYRLTASAKGRYQSGIASVECMYSPAYRGNSECGSTIQVAK